MTIKEAGNQAGKTESVHEEDARNASGAGTERLSSRQGQETPMHSRLMRTI